MMPAQSDFLKIITEISESSAKKAAVKHAGIELAVVTGLTNGRAVITFDGDGAASRKVYPSMKHYIPAVGDRVMLIKGVIIGGWSV
jgi:hypothetical protein